MKKYKTLKPLPNIPVGSICEGNVHDDSIILSSWAHKDSMTMGHGMFTSFYDSAWFQEITDECEKCMGSGERNGIVDCLVLHSDPKQCGFNTCKSCNGTGKGRWKPERWTPENGGEFWHVGSDMCVKKSVWARNMVVDMLHKNYNCFQTKEQALEAAEAIKKTLKELQQ